MANKDIKSKKSGRISWTDPAFWITGWAQKHKFGTYVMGTVACAAAGRQALKYYDNAPEVTVLAIAVVIAFALILWAISNPGIVSRPVAFLLYTAIFAFVCVIAMGVVKLWMGLFYIDGQPISTAPELNRIGNKIANAVQLAESADSYPREALNRAVEFAKLAEELALVNERSDPDYTIGRDELVAHAYSLAAKCRVIYETEVKGSEGDGTIFPSKTCSDSLRLYEDKIRDYDRRSRDAIDIIKSSGKKEDGELLAKLTGDGTIARMSFNKASLISIGVLLGDKKPADLVEFISKETGDPSLLQFWETYPPSGDYLLRLAMDQETHSTESGE